MDADTNHSEGNGDERSEMEVDYTGPLVKGVRTGEKVPKFKKRELDPDDWELVDEDDCVVELVGMLNRDYLKQCDKDRIKIVGLFDDSGKVFLQLDQLVFTGEPSETFGTNVLFEEVSCDDSSDDEEDTFTSSASEVPEKKFTLQYHTKTNKKITMSRAFLSKKT